MTMITRNEAIGKYQINKKQLFGLIADGRVLGRKAEGRTSAWQINEDQLKQYVEPRPTMTDTVAPQQEDQLTLQQAEAEFGIAHQSLRAKIAKGELKATVTRTLSGQTGLVVERKAIEQFASTYKQRGRGRPAKYQPEQLRAALTQTTDTDGLNPQDFIGLVEAEKLSGIAAATIEHRARKGLIPFRKIMIGRRSRFLVYKPEVLKQEKVRGYTKHSTPLQRVEPTLPETTRPSLDQMTLNAQLESIARLVSDTGLFEVQSLDVTLRFKQSTDETTA